MHVQYVQTVVTAYFDEFVAVLTYLAGPQPDEYAGAGSSPYDTGRLQ